MPDLDAIISMLDDIDAIGVGVTEWEAEFVDRMLKLTDADKCPTSDQIAKIMQIHEERC
jgi:hypothetical protein